MSELDDELMIQKAIADCRAKILQVTALELDEKRRIEVEKRIIGAFGKNGLSGNIEKILKYKGNN